jgi:Zn finger protein HypA/HybF involved in hydrogenase expression
MPPERQYQYAECPDCGEDIRHVDFVCNTSGREWGTDAFPVFNGNTDYHDSEQTDSYDFEYRCPECEYEFTDEELNRMNEPFLAEQQNNSGYNNSWSRPSYSNTRLPNGQEEVECPHCHHSYTDQITAEMYCPRCSESFTPDKDDIPEITVNRQPRPRQF